MTAAAALEDSHESWISDAVATIIGLAHVQEEFTADDLRREMRPAPMDKLPGLAFTAAKRAGYIEPINTTVSKSRSRNCGSLKIWRRRINEGVAL
jgi:hypothetical protein